MSDIPEIVLATVSRAHVMLPSDHIRMIWCFLF
jgi:hypothetical protein